MAWESGRQPGKHKQSEWNALKNCYISPGIILGQTFMVEFKWSI
jgi:hypothetical protein